MSTVTERQVGRVLAEVLRLQRWAGAWDEASPARLFGLMHGFESALRKEFADEGEEILGIGISEETENVVEEILQQIDQAIESERPLDGQWLKGQLWEKSVSETDAIQIMRFLKLQNHLVEAIDAVAPWIHAPLARPEAADETRWFGGLQYMELYDTTEGARKKLHSAFAASVPRVGEIVEPENGSAMAVVKVSHVARTERDSNGFKRLILVPHVDLEAIEEE